MTLARPSSDPWGYHVIAAGGGSIAWQEAGAMRVGPQSAGANPGPVYYGGGGTEPTVSDANLVLSRLDKANFLGSGMTLDRAAATTALATMGATNSMTAEAMAHGVLDQDRTTGLLILAAIGISASGRRSR